LTYRRIAVILDWAQVIGGLAPSLVVKFLNNLKGEHAEESTERSRAAATAKTPALNGRATGRACLAQFELAAPEPAATKRFASRVFNQTGEFILAGILHEGE
jgi:hypothetical protein